MNDERKECKHPLPDVLSGFGGNIKFASHRGSGRRNRIPENTLAAFEYSLKKGFQVNELDVRVSKDNVPIVFHGPRLETTTSGQGWAERKTFNELKGLDWGFYTHRSARPTKKPVPILSLEEYLVAFGKKCYTNIEIKRNRLWTGVNLENKILELVRKYQLERRVFFSSFHFLSLYKLRKLASDCSIGLLIAPNLLHEMFAGFFRKIIRPNSVHMHTSVLTKKKVAKWKKRGYYFVIWGENSLENLEKLFKWGVDLAIVDDLDLPQNFARYLESK